MPPPPAPFEIKPIDQAIKFGLTVMGLDLASGPDTVVYALYLDGKLVGVTGTRVVNNGESADGKDR